MDRHFLISPPAPGRRQALQQARPHPQRLPAPGRASQRRRSLSISSAAKTPAISRATVYRTLQWMVDAGIARKVDFGEGRSRFEPSYRHPRHFHLICNDCHRSSEFLSSDIEALRRGNRRGAQFRADADRRPDLRHLRGVPHRHDRRRRSTARRPSWCSRATRCASRSPPSAAASSSTRAPPRMTQDRARPHGVPEARRRREGASRHAREALPRAARAGSAARVAADVPVLQGRGQRPVRRGRRAAAARASTISRRCSSASSASAARTSSSSNTASGSRIRKASRSSSSSPTKSARTSTC